jgi:hypothetical protein
LGRGQRFDLQKNPKMHQIHCKTVFLNQNGHAKEEVILGKRSKGSICRKAPKYTKYVAKRAFANPNGHAKKEVIGQT